MKENRGVSTDKKRKEARYVPQMYGKRNLIIFCVSLLLIIVGYLLMSGGKSADGVSFNPEVFSYRRIRLAPLLCTLGYLGGLVAALYRQSPRQEGEGEKTEV